MTTVALIAALIAPNAGQAHPHGPARTATITAYCARCSGSIGCRDNRLRAGDCAADPRWHRYGSRVWIRGFGTLVVRDTGGAIKGRDRFDVYLGGGKCKCGTRVGRVRRQYREVR